MKTVFLACLLGCAFLAHAETETIQDPIYDADGKIVTEDMTYEELMDFSDQKWDDVEHGVISPQAADEEFTELTGYAVLDWLVANGEIKLATDEGMVDDSADTEQPTALFQKGFLQE